MFTMSGDRAGARRIGTLPELIVQADGINLGPLFHLTKPVDSEFAWINQGTTTVEVTENSLFINDATAGSLNIRVRKKTAPSTPYTITTLWIPRLISTGSNFTGIAIGFRQSSDGKLVVFSFRSNAGQANLTVDKYTNATTFSASYTNQNIYATSAVQGLRIIDNGTNRLCQWSSDGQNWITIHTIGRTDFLTADEVWFGLYVNTNQGAGTLLSWKQT